MEFLTRTNLLFLALCLISTLLDCTPRSFELELMKISNLQNEPVYGLETVEEQMAFFDKISYKTQAEKLVKLVKYKFNTDKKELQLLMNAYQSKNLNEIQRLPSSSKSALISDYEDLLLNNRNKNWVHLIPKISSDKPTFFGVGAAHLFGKKGVINLLRDEGYTVEAIQN